MRDDRRALIKGAAGLAALAFLGAGCVRKSPVIVARTAHNPFLLGVASGEPALDGFVLWTRLIGVGAGDVKVGFEVAEDESFGRVVRKGRAIAFRHRAHAVHLEVAGLRPGRPYWFRFHVAGATSRIGRTATIGVDPDRVRLALTSCQHFEHGYFSGYADMRANEVDAVVQVGDYIYEKSFGAGPNVRSFDSPNPITLDDYRARHALYRTDPDLADAHANIPFIVSWDDHEVENDYGGINGGAHQGAEFLAIRAAAYRAYFEHMPLRPNSLKADASVQLYRAFRWGSLARLVMLDTRQYRTARPCTTPEERGGRVVAHCAAALNPSATMLGVPQERWLDRQLGESDERWTLIAQQTLFSRLFLPQGRDALYTDIWDAYGRGRERLLTSVARHKIGNPVILSGDVHSFWANDVRRDFGSDHSETVATEIVTSCLASRNGPDALFGTAKALNPHVRFLDNRSAGYALLDIDRSAIRTDFRKVRDLSNPQSLTDSLATVAIQAGKPGIA